MLRLLTLAAGLACALLALPAEACTGGNAEARAESEAGGARWSLCGPPLLLPPSAGAGAQVGYYEWSGDETSVTANALREAALGAEFKHLNTWFVAHGVGGSVGILGDEKAYAGAYVVLP